MKLIFNIFIIIFHANAYCARDIILISYDNHYIEAKKIKKIIQQKLVIPRELVTLSKAKRPCQPDRDTIMHICLKKKQMEIIHINDEVIKESFNFFLKD